MISASEKKALIAIRATMMSRLWGQGHGGTSKSADGAMAQKGGGAPARASANEAAQTAAVRDGSGSTQQHRFGFLDRLDVEVHRHGLAVAAAQHALERLGRAGVDFLVRHIGRHVDEVARSGLGRELELLAPAHARASAHARRSPIRGARDGGRRSWHRHGSVTVPAQSFCAPTRAKLIAAARFMPGVWRGVDVELVGGDHAHAVVLPGRACRTIVANGRDLRIVAHRGRWRNQAGLPRSAPAAARPDSYISIMMSEPPTNSPFDVELGNAWASCCIP